MHTWGSLCPRAAWGWPASSSEGQEQLAAAPSWGSRGWTCSLAARRGLVCRGLAWQRGVVWLQQVLGWQRAGTMSVMLWRWEQNNTSMKLVRILQQSLRKADRTD